MNILFVFTICITFFFEQCKALIREASYNFMTEKYATLKVSHAYHSFVGKNILQCSVMCDRDKNCISFKYNKINHVCIFVTHKCGHSSMINFGEIFARPVSLQLILNFYNFLF